MADTTPQVIPTASSAPAPAKTQKSDVASSPQPKRGAKTTRKTEVPSIPPHVYHAFEAPAVDPLVIGNKNYEFEQKLDGYLGHFIDRSTACIEPTSLTINMVNYRAGIVRTLIVVLERLYRLKGHVEQADIDARVDTLVDTLADGCVVMTYLKLRTLHLHHVGQMAKFYKRPKVPGNFEVPVPYALAISQLGTLKVSSRSQELVVDPTMTSIDAQLFGLPAVNIWSAARYMQVVEEAKKVGMRFQSVDLQVKVGSSWWLYKQALDDNIFTLTCIIPEDNYTEATATLHTLWCTDGQGGFLNEFVNVTPLGTDSYGTMLRNPHVGINVSTYFAIDEAPDDVWKID